MPTARCMLAETLDCLPADDPRARQSRRVNALMGHPLIFARAVRAAALPPPLRIVDLGAGDGTLMLGLARRWAALSRVLRLRAARLRDLATRQPPARQ